MEQLVHAEIEAYLANLGRTRDQLLAEMESRAAASKFPIIGPLVVIPILISLAAFIVGFLVFSRLTPKFAESL